MDTNIDIEAGYADADANEIVEETILEDVSYYVAQDQLEEQ